MNASQRVLLKKTDAPLPKTYIKKTGNNNDPQTEPTVFSFPRNIKLINNNARETIKTNKEVSNPHNSLKIIDKPDTPPNTKLFGRRKKVKPQEKTYNQQ